MRRAVISPRFLIACIGYWLLLCINLPINPWPADAAYYFSLSYKYGFYIFFYLCAAIPYATSFLSDVDQNNFQPILRRVSLPTYSLSKCITTALSGSLAVVAATGLFVLYLLVRFPGQMDYTQSYSGWDSLLLSGSPFVYYAAKAGMTAMLGGSFAVIALAVSTRIRNSFVVLATPVLLYYALNQIPVWINMPVFLCIGTLLYVPAFQEHYFLSMLYLAALTLLIFAAATGVFYLQMRRLRKNGYCT